jgi:hypothetical protein
LALLSEDGFSSIFDYMGDDRHDWLVVSKLGEMGERLPTFDASCVEFIRRVASGKDDSSGIDFTLDFPWNVGAFYKLLEEVQRVCPCSSHVQLSGTYNAAVLFRRQDCTLVGSMKLRNMSRRTVPRSALFVFVSFMCSSILEHLGDTPKHDFS